jgi:outer membrane murein-binding lipoprotein Lpp
MIFRITLPLVVATLLLAGCSGDEGKKEQGAIEKQTEQTAKAAVEAIKTPIDKARTAAGQQNDQARTLKEQAGEQ